MSRWDPEDKVVTRPNPPEHLVTNMDRHHLYPVLLRSVLQFKNMQFFDERIACVLYEFFWG